jgi:hypothetical protein
MKNIIATAAVIAALSTAAYAGNSSTTLAEPVVMASAADNIAFVGYAEYFTEAETTEIGVGIEIGLTNRFAVTPTLVFAGSALDELDLNEIDIVAAYDLNRMVALQGVFTLDDNLDYKETRLGAVFDVGYNVALTPEVLVDNDFEVQSLRLTAGYGITENVGIYARVESDNDYEYNETAVGVSFKF